MTATTTSAADGVRTALVTGGGRGLGRSIAEALADRGFHVVVTHRPQTADADATLQAIRKRGGTADSMPLDLADMASFPAFRESLERRLRERHASTLDALVNNAGIGVFRTFDELTLEDYEESFAVNSRGPLFLTQALLDLMPPGAGVVNVSTQMTRQANATSLVYSASKAALESLSATLAMALGREESASTRSLPAPPRPTSTVGRCATVKHCASTSATTPRSAESGVLTTSDSPSRPSSGPTWHGSPGRGSKRQAAHSCDPIRRTYPWVCPTEGENMV